MTRPKVLARVSLEQLGWSMRCMPGWASPEDDRVVGLPVRDADDGAHGNLAQGANIDPLALDRIASAERRANDIHGSAVAPSRRSREVRPTGQATRNRPRRFTSRARS